MNPLSLMVMEVYSVGSRRDCPLRCSSDAIIRKKRSMGDTDMVVVPK